jgi:hypothetical protein
MVNLKVTHIDLALFGINISVVEAVALQAGMLEAVG